MRTQLDYDFRNHETLVTAAISDMQIQAELNAQRIMEEVRFQMAKAIAERIMKILGPKIEEAIGGATAPTNSPA